MGRDKLVMYLQSIFFIQRCVYHSRTVAGHMTSCDVSFIYLFSSYKIVLRLRIYILFFPILWRLLLYNLLTSTCSLQFCIFSSIPFYVYIYIYACIIFWPLYPLSSILHFFSIPILFTYLHIWIYNLWHLYLFSSLLK